MKTKKLHTFDVKFHFPPFPWNYMHRSLYWRNITSEECEVIAPFCPLIVRGGISGGESIVSNDTGSSRKMYQTDYSSDDRVGRAGSGLILSGVILCDLSGNWNCAERPPVTETLRIQEFSLSSSKPEVLSCYSARSVRKHFPLKVQNIFTFKFCFSDNHVRFLRSSNFISLGPYVSVGWQLFSAVKIDL